jgi:hypothetical protein
LKKHFDSFLTLLGSWETFKNEKNKFFKRKKSAQRKVLALKPGQKKDDRGELIKKLKEKNALLLDTVNSKKVSSMNWKNS